jgi:hypothetical protein
MAKQDGISYTNYSYTSSPKTTSAHRERWWWYWYGLGRARRIVGNYHCFTGSFGYSRVCPPASVYSTRLDALTIMTIITGKAQSSRWKVFHE